MKKVAGPSGSGKTTILYSILKDRNQIFKKAPKYVVLYYSVWQDIYTKFKKEGLVDNFYEGIPDEKSFIDLVSPYKNVGGSLCLFDDLGASLKTGQLDFIKLYSVTSHHFNVTPFLVLHNLFEPHLRSISLNCHHFFLSKSSRDLGQLSSLSRQSFGRSNYLPKCMSDASNRLQFPYLHINFNPSCNDILRVTTCIFSREHPTIVYQMSQCDPKNPFTSMVLVKEAFYNNILESVTGGKIVSAPPTNNSYITNNNVNETTVPRVAPYSPVERADSAKSPHKFHQTKEETTQTFVPHVSSAQTDPISNSSVITQTEGENVDESTQTQPAHSQLKSTGVQVGERSKNKSVQTFNESVVTLKNESPSVKVADIKPKIELHSLPPKHSRITYPIDKQGKRVRRDKIPAFKKIFKKSKLKNLKKHVCKKPYVKSEIKKEAKDNSSASSLPLLMQASATNSSDPSPPHLSQPSAATGQNKNMPEKIIKPVRLRKKRKVDTDSYVVNHDKRLKKSFPFWEIYPHPVQ